MGYWGFITPEALGIAVTVLLAGILVESLLIFLIVDMKRWNTFTQTIFAISFLDILALISELVSYITGFNHAPEIITATFIVLPVAIIEMSVVVSLTLSYRVIYLLRHREILVASKMSWQLQAFYIAMLIPIAICIWYLILYDRCNFRDDDDEGGSCSTGTESMRLPLYNLYFAYGLTLILSNFVMFALGLYFSRKTLFRDAASRTTLALNHQAAIAQLVSRMKFYPLIQAIFFLIYFLNSYSNIWVRRRSPFFIILYLIPPLSYLILYLKMQPTAYDHLLTKAGCRSNKNNAPPTRVSRLATAIDTQHPVDENLSTKLTASSEHDSDSAIHEYWRVAEDDELESMISSRDSAATTISTPYLYTNRMSSVNISYDHNDNI